MTRLWDKHLPDWRKSKSQERKREPEVAKVLLDEVKRIEKEAVESPDAKGGPSLEDMQFAQMKRSVMRHKGKWERFGPDIK